MDSGVGHSMRDGTGEADVAATARHRLAHRGVVTLLEKRGVGALTGSELLSAVGRLPRASTAFVRPRSGPGLPRRRRLDRRVLVGRASSVPS